MVILEHIPKEVIGGLLALSGVIVGLCYPSLVEYIKFRFKRKKELNKIIANILELWFQYFRLNITDVYREITELIKAELNLEDLSEKEMSGLKIYWETILKEFIKSVHSDSFSRIKSEYSVSVSVFSEYSPILAFRMRGIECHYDDIQKYDSLIENIKSKFNDAFTQSDELRKFIGEKIHQLKPVIDDLESNILDLSFYFDVMLYFRLKYYFWRKGKIDKIKLEKYVNEFRDLIKNIINKHGKI